MTPDRVSFSSSLASIRADLGHEIMVEGEGRFYRAEPITRSVSGCVDGPIDGLPRITWVPLDGKFDIATVEEGGSATAIWSLNVGAASIVEVEASLSLFSGESPGVASKIAKGVIACVAHRHGSGSLAIDSQAVGVPWVLTDSYWNPVFDTSSNTLRLVITPDSTQKIDGTVAVSVKTTDTSGTQAPDITPLEAARALILADAPSGIFYADVGLTPATPSAGDDITAWADQSGNARHGTFADTDRPKYRVDSGGHPYLECLPAYTVLMSTAGAQETLGNGVEILWTMAKPTGATSQNGTLFFLGSCYARVSWDTNKLEFVPGNLNLGTIPSTGVHSYRVTISAATGSNRTVTLYIDGVAGTPQTATDVAITSALKLGFNGSATLPPEMLIYGFCWRIGSSGSADTMAHWNAMAGAAGWTS